MEHKPLDQIRSEAKVVPFVPRSKESSRLLRRQRLERFAALLDRHDCPVRLLSRIEYLREAERMLLRADQSPLTIAYADESLRAQGLAGDRLGDAIAFFNLTAAEAHHLLCDCHYTSASVDSKMVAARARSIARRMTIGEMWAKVRSALAAW